MRMCVHFGRTDGVCFTLVKEEEGGRAVLTKGCLGRAGSEFQCRVSQLYVCLYMYVYYAYFYTCPCMCQPLLSLYELSLTLYETYLNQTGPALLSLYRKKNLWYIVKCSH